MFLTAACRNDGKLKGSMHSDIYLQSNSNRVRNILIVDDNPVNLRILADYLEAHQYGVLVARDGQSGLDKAEFALPDLILLDVMMPEIDGFETCRLLKLNKKTANIPVIFMTALSETENKLEGFNAGAVDYVTKPLQQKEVLARIRTHLRLRELTEELEELVAARTAELETAYRALSKMDKTKGDFISIMSHELRTPLAVIDGYTQLLQDSMTIKEDDELTMLVDNILKGTTRMLRTMNDIFDVTRIENDVLNVFKEKVDVAAIFNEIIEKLEPALAGRQIYLERRALDDLPPLRADKSLITKVFYHLVVNAVKYTPDGGRVLIEGQVCTTNDDQELKITVSDNGIGIDPSQLNLIFEKFYQTGKVNLHSSGTTTFKGGGPGLGLAIAKGIVDAHNGRIWAESEGVDEKQCLGSRFYVSLPMT